MSIEISLPSALMDRLPNPFAMFDGNTRLLYANPSMLEVFGIKETAYRGKTLLDLVPINSFHHPAAAYANRLDVEAIASGTAIRTRQAIPQVGGSTKVFDVLRAVSETEKGMVLLVHAYEIESAIANAGHVVRRNRFELAGRLACGAAYRTTELVGQILASRPKPSDRIVGASTEIEGLAKRILDVSQDLPAQSMVIDFGHLVNEIVTLFSPTLPAHIRCETDFVEEELNCVADPAILAQALLAVLWSAEAALPNQGSMLIGLRSEKNCAEFSVHLRGEILPHNQRIILPEQATMAVAAMGGQMNHSEGSHSWRIDLRFPLSEQVPRKEDKRQHLLVVDDDPVIQDVIRSLLARTYSVTCCASAAEALALPEKTHLCAALIDINLPNMDGIQLSAALRKTRPQLPVLFMSGNVNDQRLADLRAYGTVHCIEKPFTVGMLDHALHLTIDQAKI
jgi:CheY-like chemotaxis protein/nitrogen-specific signal transduction histidine kinase